MFFTNESLNNSIWGGNSFIICAYILCIALVIKQRRQYPRVFVLFFPLSIICMVIAYNPLFYSAFLRELSVPKGQNAVYGRMEYLLMIEILMTIGVVLTVSGIKGRMGRVLATVIITMLLLSTMKNDRNYRPFSTDYDIYYKTSRKVIDIDEYIISHTVEERREKGIEHVLLIGNEDEISSLKETDPDLYYNYYDMLQLTQQYTGEIRVEQAEEYDETAKNRDYHYILNYTGKENCDKIEQDGYRQIWTDGTGILYEK